ncbi:MAG: tetratricopeptide repeat protein [Hyphomicrobiales bacterium]
MTISLARAPFLGMLAVFLASSAAVAGIEDPDLAFGAYQRGRYRDAFREATTRVENDHNDGAAMALLGELTGGGLGIAPDLKKAADWFALAAARGDRNGAYALAMMVLEGRGVPKDRGRAKSLLEQAAKAGQPSAAYNLGVMELAEGTPDGDERGLRLVRQGADAGVPEAEYALATLLREGKVVSADREAAARMMGRAARDFYEPAEIEYAIMLFNGDGVPKDEGAAARLFLRAAARGNPIAQNRIARLYVSGRGVATDLVEAAAWNTLAQYAGRDDPWLNSATANLSPEQRQKALGLVRKRLSAFQLGITSP